MTMGQSCRAWRCRKTTEPRLIMCSTHGRRLPKPLKEAVLREYRRGQERDNKAAAAAVLFAMIAVAVAALAVAVGAT